MSKGFDIASIIGNVSVSDTVREQIEYIEEAKLRGDEANFYELSGLEELAANIELIGLQQPLRVRPDPDDVGGYIVVSGHRRLAAIRTALKPENPERWAEIPCIVERDEVSPAMRELRLIYANADTRRMSDADIWKQAKRVQELFCQLKEEGVEFPGRMRDRVAEACHVNATKLATLKVIDDGLLSNLRPAYESGRLATETAYNLARMSADMQIKITHAIVALTASDVANISRAVENGADYSCDLSCPDGRSCGHRDAFIRHDAKAAFEQCGGKKCCLNCEYLLRNWSPCQSACSKAKEKKSAIIAEKKQKEAARAIKEQSKRDKQILENVRRLVRAADASNIGDGAKLHLGYSSSASVGDLREILRTGLDPSREGFHSESEYTAYYVSDLKKLSESLHCSADYLIGLTDELSPEADAAPKWRTGSPGLGVGDAVIMIDFADGGAPAKAFATWCLDHWEVSYGKVTDKVLCWYPLPEDPND